MGQGDDKRAAARAALELVPEHEVLGIGTGSTIDLFIDCLAESGLRIESVVSSSERSSERLRARGFDVLDLNSVAAIPIYIDGADEVDPNLRLIKGGGGALTREKILASAADRFVCIVDESKRVDTLGAFPLPVEVIPMARSLIARRLVVLGGTPVYRSGFVTDNGNQILDVHHLDLSDPERLERQINDMPGVVCNGLFALRPADLLLAGSRGTVSRHFRNRPDQSIAG